MPAAYVEALACVDPERAGVEGPGRAGHPAPALPQHGRRVRGPVAGPGGGSDAGGRGPGACGRRAMPSRSTGRGRSVELVWTGPGTDGAPVPAHRAGDPPGSRLGPAAGSRWSATPSTGFRTSARRWSGRLGGACRSTSIVETPDKLEGENEYNTLRALGDGRGGLLGGLLLAEGEAGPGRQRQGRHPARQVRRGRWPVAVPVVGEPDRVCVHDQHGAGRAGDGRGCPGQVEGHFDRLIGEQVLVKVGP